MAIPKNRTLAKEIPNSCAINKRDKITYFIKKALFTF